MLDVENGREERVSKYQWQLKEPLRLGFLSIHGRDECCSQMMKGVFEAAKVHNANVIRFSYNTNEGDMRKVPFEMTKILELYKKLKLDGLIFLGWLYEIEEETIEGILKQVEVFPILSLGKVYKNIPNVYMDGGKYLKELLIHLSKVHGYRNIAFISPLIYDNRVKVYVDTMKELGIFKSDLYLKSDILCASDFDARAEEVLNILINIRKVKFDVIVSMYNDEAVALVNKLQQRGISIPKDVAVTSYDDFESGKFNFPSLTTIYYPYWEIGYVGCEKLIELITTGYTDLSTEIPARVIYRDSCGCTKLFSSNSDYNILDTKRLWLLHNGERVEAFALEIKKHYPYLPIDVKRLLHLLLESYKEKSEDDFFIMLMQQLNNSLDRLLYPSSFEDLLEIIHSMREFVLDSVSRKEVGWGDWFNNIFYKVHTLVSEKMILAMGQREVITNRLNQNLYATGKQLITTFNISGLFDILTSNLPKLDIPSCYIFLFNGTDYSYENCILAFEYSGGKKRNLEGIKTINCIKYMDKLLMQKKIILTQLLCIGEELSGLVLFEPSLMDERMYNLLAVYLSSAINGTKLLNNLNIAKKDSELNALQSQINPHFLYNTLEILYWEATAAGQKNISEMLINLSRLFRLMLNKGKSFILISREKELIQCYLNLQKMRLEEKLNFTIKLDDNILNYMIPKLTLQPFIENSIVHGLEGKITGGNIEILGTLINKKIKFRITDDGIGMSRETISEILACADKNFMNKSSLLEGYAIKNVVERLKLYFTNEYSLEFYSEIGRGTTVEIVIPAEEYRAVRKEDNLND